LSQRIKKTHPLLLAGLAVGMFGFAFALVPIYDIICEVTGLNGKTSTQASLIEEIESSLIPIDREIKIQFLAKAARGMPWEFRPTEGALYVRPGEVHHTTFYVRNRAQTTITGQAVPSVSPGQAAIYLKKIECFCFQQQELMAGNELEMGVSFVVDTDIPSEIKELTLSYTMFNVTDIEQEGVASHNEPEHITDHE
jgi:cytochrome c oxidase assembly protein subunit 11